MPRFVYRLQTLLDQKAEAKQSAQQALAARQRELAEEQRILEECVQEKRTAAGRLLSARQELFVAGQPVSGNAIEMRRDYIRRLEADLVAATDGVRLQEDRAQEAQERVKSAQRTLTEVSRQVEVLERHRQRLEARFQREQERKEAIEHDETGNTMYLRRRQQA